MLYSTFQPLYYTGKCHQYVTPQNPQSILVKLNILISKYTLVATPELH